MFHRIQTYINNLHPHTHCELYSVIEDVIAAALPLWNQTLAPFRRLDTFTHDWEFRKYAPEFRRIPFEEATYDPDPANDKTHPFYTDYPKDQLEFKDVPKDLQDIIDDVHNEWCEMIRQRVQPDAPLRFDPPPQTKSLDLKETFGRKPLQIIVKMANIQLTPEKATYDGGSWHVEGKLVSDCHDVQFHAYMASLIITRLSSMHSERVYLR